MHSTICISTEVKYQVKAEEEKGYPKKMESEIYSYREKGWVDCGRRITWGRGCKRRIREGLWRGKANSIGNLKGRSSGNLLLYNIPKIYTYVRKI